jgi:hypothetical protein
MIAEDAFIADAPTDDDLLTGLALDKLIAPLGEEDQLVIRAHLADVPLHELGIGISERDYYRVQQVTHRMAVLGGIQIRCKGKCGRTLPADQFGWNSLDMDGVCRDCEAANRRWSRSRVERWQDEARVGAQSTCRHCGHTGPVAEDFPWDTRTTCRTCVSEQHRRRTSGKRAGSTRTLTDDQVREIRREHAAGGITMTALAERFGIGESSIRKILNRTTYRDVE